MVPVNTHTVAPLSSLADLIPSDFFTMLATIALIAALIYEWVGLAVLRNAWVNVDLIWTLALGATGTALLVASGT